MRSDTLAVTSVGLSPIPSIFLSVAGVFVSVLLILRTDTDRKHELVKNSAGQAELLSIF
jgi:hypothetical protein